MDVRQRRSGSNSMGKHRCCQPSSRARMDPAMSFSWTRCMITMMALRRGSFRRVGRGLFSGSGALGSRDERPDERGEEGLSPPAGVVDHLEEGEVERQLLLR